MTLVPNQVRFQTTLRTGKIGSDDGCRSRFLLADNQASMPIDLIAKFWLREPDSNRRPSGYEPAQLPLLHPALFFWRRARELNPQAAETTDRLATCFGSPISDDSP